MAAREVGARRPRGRGREVKVLRVFYHWCSPRKLRLFLVEQAALLLAFEFGALAAGAGGGRPTALAGLGALALTCGVFVQASYYFADLYDLPSAMADRAAGVRQLRALGIALLLFALFAPLVPGQRPPGALLAGVAAAAFASLIVRAAMPRLLGPAERVLVAGAGPRARAAAALVGEGGEFTLAGTSGPGEPVERAALRLGAEVVVVAREEGEPPPDPQGLVRLRLRGVPVFEASSFAERALRRLPIALLRTEELAFAEGFRLRRLDLACKRALDLAAAVPLTLLAAPLVLVAGLLVRLDSKGPVFYHQERVGKDGRVFRLTKLRTMRVDAESAGAPVWAQRNDGRVTRIGRLLRTTRLDELPQVLAVLRGDMSLVGPRPERPFFVEQIKREVPFYGMREAAKPGITGWAQVRYPYGASIEDARAKLEYDLYYLKNRSFFLDLAILFHTARHVLTGRGAR
jgi:exopolysaccharide biosynthesis polyprenyl glycosylphosphotransferase